MTKKHFEAIASKIAATKAIANTDRERINLQNLACRLADSFEQANPRFDRTRFINACGFLSTRPIGHCMAA